MKNLKKVLSLVLALAMALSLMTAAFAADASDYKDYSKVTYKEAVDVMTAAGVFNGGDGNNFNPDATLTREQAAKIITYMLMGQKEADKLTTTIAPYADVAATRWSAGSIAYCTNEGIIAGDGNGRFNPTAGVTGLQFGKMLLVALGYDAKIEKLVGNSWAINAATLAINAGLDEDMEISLSKELTREEAAQMAYNAMQADVVDYENRGTEITLPGGGTVVIDASKASAVTTNRDWGTNIVKEKSAPYTVQFAEQYCRDLTLTGNKSADDFGRPAHTWKYDKNTVGTYADEAALTYTTAVKGTELANDIDDAGYEATGPVDQYRNNNVKNVTYSASEFANMLKSSSTIDGTGNGVVLEFYADDNDVINRVVVTATYLGEVTTITKDKASTNADERALKVSVDGFAKTMALDADTTAGFDDVYDNVKVGDKVLVTPKGDNSGSNEAVSVAIPETVEAAITKVNTSDKELTIGGEVYGIAKTSTQTYKADTDEVIVYLDQNGYVLAATNQGDNSDKAAVLLKKYQTLLDGELTDMIRVITFDGEVHEWEAASNNGTLVVGGFYEYQSNDDDEYTLTEAPYSGTYADGEAICKQNVQLSEKDKSLELVTGKKAYFASDVKFIFVNNDGTYTVKDGVQKIGDATTVMGTIDMDGNTAYIKTLFVYGGATSSTSSSDDIIYVAGNGTPTGTTSVVVDGKTKTFHTYDAYINGEEVEDFYSSNASASGFYTKEVEDNSGAYVLNSNTKYTANTGDLAVVTGASYGSYAGNIMTAGGNDYDTSNAVIDDTTDNDLDSLSAIDEMKNEGKNITVAVIYDADNNNASYVYVTSVA